MSPKTIPVLVTPPPIAPIKLTDYQVNPITGCWIWFKHTDGEGNPIDGYGRFIGREVYRRKIGEIPEGNDVYQLCCNPRCINPEHLYADNTPLFNSEKGARLNMTLAREIREKAVAGVRSRILARLYGVARTTIRSVLLNVAWVDPEYQPILKSRSRHEADRNVVKKVRALRAAGMSYGEIVNRTRISRAKVKNYCSGRYLGQEYNDQNTIARDGLLRTEVV